MPNDTVPAGGEAVPSISRRTALRAGIVLALTSHTPAIAAEPAPELPVDKVNRLAEELAHALNEYSYGQFHAVIYPSEQADWPICFRVTRLENDPQYGLRQQVEATKTAMARANPGFDIQSRLLFHETGHCTALIFTR